MVWKVTHHFTNPQRNRTEEFGAKADAVTEAKIYQSDDPGDSQVSYIENPDTGEWGSRTWGKKNISWKK